VLVGVGHGLIGPAIRANGEAAAESGDMDAA
jgi:hypothetical protein